MKNKLNFLKNNTIIPIILITFIFSLFFSSNSFSKETQTITIENLPTIFQTKRPRLYITQEKIQFIKNRLGTNPYSLFWKQIKKTADNISTEAPPNTFTQYNDETIRKFGNKLPFLALSYKLTGDYKYLESAKSLTLAICSSENWASNNDIGAAHLLFGVSLTYDWLNDNFSENEKINIRNKLIKHASILYSLYKENKIWWSKDLLQNHNYTNMMSLCITGIALSGETIEAENWIKAAHENFSLVFPLLSPDGASHEGINYWGYGMDSMLKYAFSINASQGPSWINSTTYFKNAAAYRLYTSLPGYKEHADYADCQRNEWYGPGYILRALANVYRDPYAQGLAESIESARGKTAVYSWQDLLWYDETIETAPPNTLSLLHNFDNLGFAIIRSDWTDNALWIFFKYGPPQGYLAHAKAVTTGSHIHPDTGNILAWCDGTWLLQDDGNSDKTKRTLNHNVLVANGYGQAGEGGRWFNGKEAMATMTDPTRAIITDIQSGIFIEANLQAAYSQLADIKKWTRTIAILPSRKTFVISDDVELNKSGNIDFYFNYPLDGTFTTDEQSSNISIKEMGFGIYGGEYVNQDKFIKGEGEYIKTGYRLKKGYRSVLSAQHILVFPYKSLDSIKIDLPLTHNSQIKLSNSPPVSIDMTRKKIIFLTNSKTAPALLDIIKKR